MRQEHLAEEQFSLAAEAYRTSVVHAQGPDLARLGSLGRSNPRSIILDLGCGAGHAGLAFWDSARVVVAYDLSKAMLQATRDEAHSRGLEMIAPLCGAASFLPFGDDSFDVVVTRFSAHHWEDVPSALREVARILKPSGTFVVIDVVTSDVPAIDSALQAIELLRDMSHVRDYRVTEWIEMLHDAGFEIDDFDRWSISIEFGEWVSRIGTTTERIEAIIEIFAHLSTRVRTWLHLHEDMSFRLQVAQISSKRRR
ncbi:MAG: class I SAM-dependent methyltransferase [Ferrimicrobium sp.]